MTTCAIIVSAGRGHRFGAGLPKQYCDLAGQPVVRRTLRQFISHPMIDHVIGVVHPDDVALFEGAADGFDDISHTPGGAERQDSVRNGLQAAAAFAPDKVLIHDAARPLVSHRIISDILAALDQYPGAVPAVAVADTLKRGDGKTVHATVDRTGLFRVQTPQGFRFDEIFAAHQLVAGQALTDDAAVAETNGLAVAIVAGDENNLKITTQEDMVRATELLSKNEFRTGLGFDVHRFEPGDAVRLCGIDIPFDRKLAGHSDADVALHAATDAILGAIGGGDIGAHFPPTEPQWRGADSEVFLKKAADMVRDEGGVIVNLDITIICEAPKIGPHRDAMRARVAGILAVAEGQVNVKATTTERLGFTGRGEGIAAQAIATVRF